MTLASRKILQRHDDRIIIHFDYDCFYASVFEAENPSLKTLPLAVQQKQIIVTCNYVARKRGLKKLQLITEAKQLCPDLIIVLGEDLTRFRNASKDLYKFLRSYSWNQKAERLGFDEVFMDATDMIDYNMQILNHNDLVNSFFQLSREDPTIGFQFDASQLAGHSYPAKVSINVEDILSSRLILGSHLARHLRLRLEEEKNYTSTVGIATNKVLSKLVGNLNKPRGQTTLLPPYTDDSSTSLPECSASNAIQFMDTHDIGAVPWIGFKLAQKLRHHFLGREAVFSKDLIYGGTAETVTVRDIRTIPNLTSEILEQVLAGPGMQNGIGQRVFQLIHGVDDTQVAPARDVPRQISIEDSYIRLNTLDEVIRELGQLSCKLIERMRIDLREEQDVPNDNGQDSTTVEAQWIAHPQTIRLSTRARPPIDPVTRVRARTFKRISRSAPAPAFMWSLNESAATLSARLVEKALLPLFHKLHPEKRGWDLSLVNVAVTDMHEVAAHEGRGSKDGRSVKGMFERQEDFLADFRVNDESDVDTEMGSLSGKDGKGGEVHRNESHPVEGEQGEEEDTWIAEENAVENDYQCQQCGGLIPTFALAAHQRFHKIVNDDP